MGGREGGKKGRREERKKERKEGRQDSEGEGNAKGGRKGRIVNGRKEGRDRVETSGSTPMTLQSGARAPRKEGRFFRKGGRKVIKERRKEDNIVAQIGW